VTFHGETMSRGTVLVIDDEKDLIELVRYNLQNEGFEVLAARDGESGVREALDRKPDLVLIDLMLPGIDGLEVCHRLRSDERTSRIPLIMLTAKSSEADRVVGLELGADDYVTKPFSLRELTARVKAVIRRAEERTKQLANYSFGKIALDFRKYEGTKKGKKLELTPLEFQMLKLLIEKKGQVVSRNDFLDHIWGEENVSVSFRTVDSHIANIRKKIEDDPANPRYILSLRSVGYKFAD
jgi:two-component system alkaline phosphatase synthesis response regulator PhoP